MIGKFHDIDFNGVVLKIPASFIDVNDLQPILNNLMQDLESCNKSMYMPEHLNNLYELENYPKKKAIDTRRREVLESRKKEDDEKSRKILSGDVYKLQWKLYSDNAHSDTIHLGDRTFEHKDYFTNKLNIKKEFKDAVLTYIKDDMKLLSYFCETNFRMIFHNNRDGECIYDISSINFRCGYAATLEMTIDKLFLQVVKKACKDGESYTYYRTPLIKFEDGSYGYDGKKLDGYIIKNNRWLIKADEKLTLF